MNTDKTHDKKFEAAIAFLKSIHAEKNKHGNYVYQSANGNDGMNLPYVLVDFLDYIKGKDLE